MQNIKIIATGGTFDKRYVPLSGQLQFTTTHLHDLLFQCRIEPVHQVTVEVVMLIDSLEMQDAHRSQILSAVKNSSEKHIVIIHGTDTMALTARTIGAEHLDKTIVLTGAMVPVDIAQSDGLFNLGFAMASAKALPTGTYIAMNGNTHVWNNVHKNTTLGIFEA